MIRCEDRIHIIISFLLFLKDNERLACIKCYSIVEEVSRVVFWWSQGQGGGRFFRGRVFVRHRARRKQLLWIRYQKRLCRVFLCGIQVGSKLWFQLLSYTNQSMTKFISIYQSPLFSKHYPKIWKYLKALYLYEEFSSYDNTQLLMKFKKTNFLIGFLRNTPFLPFLLLFRMINLP